MAKIEYLAFLCPTRNGLFTWVYICSPRVCILSRLEMANTSPSEKAKMLRELLAYRRSAEV